MKNRAVFIRSQQRRMKRVDKIMGLILKLNNLKKGISSLAIAQERDSPARISELKIVK